MFHVQVINLIFSEKVYIPSTWTSLFTEVVTEYHFDPMLSNNNEVYVIKKVIWNGYVNCLLHEIQLSYKKDLYF